MLSFSFGANNGTSIAKYQPPIGTDTIINNGQSRTVNTKAHCISVMKEYECKSLEELRMEDYLANRKGSQAETLGSFTFGATLQPSTFGQTTIEATEKESIFGLARNAFGQIVGTTTQPIRSTGPTCFGATDSCTSFGGKSAFAPTVQQTSKNWPLNGTELFGAPNRPSAPDKSLVDSTISVIDQPATTVFGITPTQSFGPKGAIDVTVTSTDVSSSVGNKPPLFFGQTMDTSIASAFGPATCLNVGSGVIAEQQQKNAFTENTKFGGSITHVGGTSSTMRPITNFGLIPSYILYLFIFLVVLSFLSFVLRLLSILPF